ncbi:MAG: hypothetical protein MJA27_07755 [Pseudanabaenales cyanobacterium]|nr:hypothetical protein [Pseudanabaenales cyanobacterium]
MTCSLLINQDHNVLLEVWITVTFNLNQQFSQAVMKRLFLTFTQESLGCTDIYERHGFISSVYSIVPIQFQSNVSPYDSSCRDLEVMHNGLQDEYGLLQVALPHQGMMPTT